MALRTSLARTIKGEQQQTARVYKMGVWVKSGCMMAVVASPFLLSPMQHQAHHSIILNPSSLLPPFNPAIRLTRAIQSSVALGDSLELILLLDGKTV
jgi:hypothetical protein